jgi:hypothetical protein
VINVWTNLETIKFYERKDQYSRMINLLQGLNVLVNDSSLVELEGFNAFTITVASLDHPIVQNEYLHIVRQINSPYNSDYEYETIGHRQTISVANFISNYHNQAVISKLLFNDGY